MRVHLAHGGEHGECAPGLTREERVYVDLGGGGEPGVDELSEAGADRKNKNESFVFS